MASQAKAREISQRLRHAADASKKYLGKGNNVEKMYVVKEQTVEEYLKTMLSPVRMVQQPTVKVTPPVIEGEWECFDDTVEMWHSLKP